MNKKMNLDNKFKFNHINYIKGCKCIKCYRKYYPYGDIPFEIINYKTKYIITYELCLDCIKDILIKTKKLRNITTANKYAIKKFYLDIKTDKLYYINTISNNYYFNGI
jgi:hypothetical protein